MIKEEKIKAIQYVIDHPNTDELEELYYKLLKDMEDLKHNYSDYMITCSIDKELERLPEADYELSTALLTMLLREDYFSNGSLMRRYESGQLNTVLMRMIETLKN